MSSGSESEMGAHAGQKKAQTFFQTGNDAALKSNLDYAIQMYREACKVEPGNLTFRQALRGVQRRKFNNEPSKVGRLVGARTQPIRMRARSATGKGNFAQALDLCEEAFIHSPWDVGAARDASDAAEGLGLKVLSQWLLESVQAVATDAEFFRHMAHVYETNCVWPKAIACWEKVKKLSPNDEDAHRKINALAASATIQRSGLNEALTKKPSGSSGPDNQKEAELEEMRQPQLSPEQRWQKEIQENPTHVGPYLQFAEHLKGRSKLDDAEKVLARGLKANPDDPSLQFAYAEVQLSRLHRAIASFSQRVKEKPDDEAAKAKLDQLQTMLVEYEVKEYRRRVALSPGDASLHYELGLRLAKAGHHKDAIASFQQARSSSTYQVQALLQAGLSFEAEGSPKLAERHYQDALKAADATDHNIMNSLHYRLGRVYEAMGNPQAAEEHYNEVAANDYGYLDVAQRLRSLS